MSDQLELMPDPTTVARLVTAYADVARAHADYAENVARNAHRAQTARDWPQHPTATPAVEAARAAAQSAALRAQTTAEAAETYACDRCRDAARMHLEADAREHGRSYTRPGHLELAVRHWIRATEYAREHRAHLARGIA